MEYKMKPAYKGYKAYEYLEEGKDFPKFEWADWDWAGRHVVELEPEQEADVYKRQTLHGGVPHQNSTGKAGGRRPYRSMLDEL